MKALLALVIACAVVALPRVALACPVCAGNSENGGVGRVVALGFMILLPFAIAFFVVRAVRHATKLHEEGTPQ